MSTQSTETPRWGKPLKKQKTEIRGMTGGPGLAKAAEILVTGLDGRWAYEFTLPGSRTVRSAYVHESAAAAQDEAVAFAHALLALLSAQEPK